MNGFIGDQNLEENVDSGVCKRSEFRCNISTVVCLPKIKSCDNVVDCADGTDEIGCDANTSQYKYSDIQENLESGRVQFQEFRINDSQPVLQNLLGVNPDMKSEENGGIYSTVDLVGADDDEDVK
ncbi:hypothetical protein GQR58_015805 [Nymphon striatum]|nr:hypothetical protein GQR58_015805 [Nymphon striatum]